MNRAVGVVPPPFRDWPKVVEMQQLTRQHIEYIFWLADSFDPRIHGSDLESKRIAVLFDKSSPKTQETFVFAAESLGAKVTSRNDMLRGSSLYEEEPIQAMLDMYLRVNMFSLFVLRMPQEWVARAMQRTKQPIINAGSYLLQHPTQALLDAYAIRSRWGSLDGLKLLLVGNMKSRVVRSLVYLVSRDFEGVELTCATPKRYALEEDIVATAKKHGVVVRQIHNLQRGDMVHLAAEHHGVYDVRLHDDNDVEKMDPEAKGFEAQPYIITQDVLSALPEKGFVQHPLPNTDLDLPQPLLDANDSYNGGKIIAVQAMTESGIAVRRALMRYLLVTGPRAYR